MRNRLLYSMILLLTPTVGFGQDDEARAMVLAKDILDRGATLFDKRDAAAIAATYIEAAKIIVIKRDSDTSHIEIETIDGRAAIEKRYGDIFKDRLPEHRCRNTVESARFLGNDLLLIHGRFAMNREQSDMLRFVQIRGRVGDQWKIVTMQLTELPKSDP